MFIYFTRCLIAVGEFVSLFDIGCYVIPIVHCIQDFGQLYCYGADGEDGIAGFGRMETVSVGIAHSLPAAEGGEIVLDDLGSWLSSFKVGG